MRRQLSPDGKTISLRNQLIAAATAGSCQVTYWFYQRICDVNIKIILIRNTKQSNH